MVSFAELSQLKAQIVVCLKVYGSPSVLGGLTVRQPDSVESYLNFGRKAGEFCHDLLENAAVDPIANQQARERARQMLECVMKSNLPKDHVAMACQGLVALFLWLVLHDPTEGEVLCLNIHRALHQFSTVVVTIGCSQKRAYVITVGDAVSDVTDALLKAEQMVGSHHEINPRTLH